MITKTFFFVVLLPVMLLRNVHSDSGTKSAASLMAAVGFPAVKRQGREVDHSVSSGAKVKNEWSYTSTSPMSPLNFLSSADIKNEWSYTSTSPICLH